MNNIIHYGDILAIPCFGILIYYFLAKKDKTILEYFLLIFAIIGFICDILFTIIFIKKYF